MSICCHEHAAIGKSNGCYAHPKDSIVLKHEEDMKEFWRVAYIKDAANRGMLPISYPNGYTE